MSVLSSLNNIAVRIFGSQNERELRKVRPLVEQINDLEPKYEAMDDDRLRGLAGEWRREIYGEPWEEARDKKDTFTADEWERLKRKLDELLPEVFAATREAAKRTLGQRHFDVQLIGGIVLHQGKISEMKTGEGKTLSSTSPLVLNALLGLGVHVITVNDYLAKRDSEWMGPIFNLLGLTVGALQHDIDDATRKQVYACDITYGTNSEFGFDYLRDNLKHRLDDMVQPDPLYFAIVDEVDSILIDEARTPLIISGEVDREDTQAFGELKPALDRLVKKQKQTVRKFFLEAQKLKRENGEDDYDYNFKLEQVHIGDPKNRELFNLIATDKSTKKNMEKVRNQLRMNKTEYELKKGLLYALNEQDNTIELTEEGQKELTEMIGDVFILPELSTAETVINDDAKLSQVEKAEQLAALQQDYQQKNEKLHAINQLLKAYNMFELDDEYVIEDGRVVIVDEFTGRKMEGRRYSDGLHQAIEAKEGLTIAKATQTIATITLQNYFRMYKKLAGMTGTADTEAEEFHKIYKLEVAVIPTHMPMVRTDNADVIYKTEKQKFTAVVEEIEEVSRQGRPILVGTTSVEKSERLHRMLKNRGVRHNVLNAKYHEREAEIVAQAGARGAVTISTNMAGRGTDIILGGNPEMTAKTMAKGDEERYQELLSRFRSSWEAEHQEVVKAGGLHIVGTERHESRRVDNQLRGRAGRQGDPGSSRFYLSLEDDLMRIFGSDSLAKIMDRIGIEDNEPIEHRMVSSAIQRAQGKVEEQNFEIRKRLIEYDDVMNKQREIIYGLRREIMKAASVRDKVEAAIEDVAADIVYGCCDEKTPEEEWDWKGMGLKAAQIFGIAIIFDPEKLDSTHPDDLIKMITDEANKGYLFRRERIGDETFDQIEKDIYLFNIDSLWQDHLLDMDHLKEGIGLAGYGQRDPLIEYKRGAYTLFEEFEFRVHADAVQRVFRIQPIDPKQAELERRRRMIRGIRLGRGGRPPAAADGGREPLQPSEDQKPVTYRREGAKVGRNDPCPCGSGKKYKKCHGA
ncbi:MAG TPA: preprotein translocase subunit SecA [bacterium]|nr:preprotein translocase subunit SecA [bacterium]